MEPLRKRPHVDACAYGADTVVFSVGGQIFEILRYRIENKPSTMLASLVSDIDTDSNGRRPIFVDANPNRFQYILDWYRYGEMYVPDHCPINAVLRDCRFFMLPDSIRINGKVHQIGVPSGTVSEISTHQLGKEVISNWPTFHEYVQTLVSKINTRIKSIVVSSARPERDSYHDLVCDLEGPLLYTETLARRDGDLVAWCDENNVCSLVRLQVLEHELKQMGLECTANGRNGRISLRVDVPLATKCKNCVHIDGVDVVLQGVRRCLAVKTY
jgi:hypothetical protein